MAATASDMNWVARLPSSTLHELAALAARHENRWEFTDPKRAAEELAQILADGGMPTIGWYRRHLAPKPPVGE